MADYGKFIGFPFKALGIAAPLVLFVMAATSHDFWLGFLDAAGVESAAHGALRRLGLVVMHGALGIMQYERTPLIPLMLVAGFGTVTVLHLSGGMAPTASRSIHRSDR